MRENYPQELIALRSRGGTVLLVGTDADTMSVVERIATLDKQCKARQIKPRSTQDPVVMIVPKRNIETWFAWLRGESVDEETVYPRYLRESDCRDDVRALDEMCVSRNLRTPALPSLQATCDEFSGIQRHGPRGKR